MSDIHVVGLTRSIPTTNAVGLLPGVCTPMMRIKSIMHVVGLTRSIPTTNAVGLLPGWCTPDVEDIDR